VWMNIPISLAFATIILVISSHFWPLQKLLQPKKKSASL